MRRRWILVIAVASSPAYADMYKCQAGGKTVYQDTPCPNAKVVNNVNGKAPPLEDQINAMYRAASDRAKAAPDTRQSNSQRQKIERPGTITAAPEGAVAGKSNSPDRYYDRPDRYYDRPDRNKNRTPSQSVNRGQNEDGAGVNNNTMPNQTSGGDSVDSAQRDWDVQMKAKRDYQKQQIPGFITHQPTDAHEMGVYKQEINRQKNMDPNTWSR